MTITSLSFAFVQYGNTAEVTRQRNAPAPAPVAVPAPTPVPAPQASYGEHPGCCDSPRRSPLFRALMEALDSVVHSAQTATAVPGTATPPSTPVAPATPAASSATAVSDAAASPPEANGPQATPTTPAAQQPPLDLDEAVMNFARALMQALRGHHGDEGSHGEDHGHRHHQHGHDHRGRMGWGDPAQRVEQLGAQLGASAPATAPTTAAPSAAAPVATSPAAGSDAPDTRLGDTVLDPVGAIDLAPAGSAQTTVVYVNLNLNGGLPGSSSLSRTQQGLLDAFGTLQQALGGPTPDPAASLKAQLSAFLQSLAEKLRAGEANAADATQPGALLHVTA